MLPDNQNCRFMAATPAEKGFHLNMAELNARDEKIAELQAIVASLWRENTELRERAEMYRLIDENSADGIWRLDCQMQFLYVSAAVKAMLGYQPDELVGQSLFSILTVESAEAIRRSFAAKRQATPPENQKRESITYTVETIHKDGHHVWVEVAVNPIFDAQNQFAGFNGITRDISERRKNEEVMRRYAFRDPLTNLPNRRLFENALGRTVSQSRRAKKKFAVMFLDVDGLKKINDHYGHVFGDALIKTMAGRIRRALRKVDFVARLAGDEFMAILPDIGDRTIAENLANRLLESCAQPVVIGDNNVHVGISIGVSFFPLNADSVTTLMNQADQAMYCAKTSGGNRCVCFSG